MNGATFHSSAGVPGADPIRTDDQQGIRLTRVFGSIAVLVESDDDSAARVRLAAGLADRFGASLRLLIPASGDATDLQGFVLGQVPAELLNQGFDRPALRLQWFPVTWGDEDSVDAACVGADLIIGQGTGAASTALAAISERLLTRRSSAMLLMPASCRSESIGRRVLVCWDDSPAAHRAVDAAMPLLSEADRICLCAVMRHARDPLRAVVEAQADRLRRRSLPVEVSVLEGSGAPGDAQALLQQASEFEADLIVAGAYEHPRWQQRLIGGNTRRLMAQSPVPLLMHH